MMGVNQEHAIEGLFYLGWDEGKHEPVRDAPRTVRRANMPRLPAVGFGPLMGLAYVIILPAVFCLAFMYLFALRVARGLKKEV